MIYDGPDATAPLFDSGSTYNRTTCPNGAWTGTTTYVPTTFTSSHLSGALTFVFTSDGSVTKAGWDATITCNSQCTAVTTWDGAGWDNGLPDASTQAIINGDYIGGAEFTACSIEITAAGTLYISPGETYIAVHNFVNEGEVYIENTGSFLQTSDEATVTGGGTYTTEQKTTMYAEYDYTYFSSPSSVATVQDFVNAGSNANYIWELNTAAYNDADGDTYDDDGEGTEWNHKTGTLTPGVGYAVLGAGADLPFDSTDIDPAEDFQDTVKFDGALISIADGYGLPIKF